MHQEAEESASDYSFDVKSKRGKVCFVDAGAEAICIGRYINDPRDDTKVDAKVYLKGARPVVMATVTLMLGIRYSSITDRVLAGQFGCMC